MRRVLIWLRNGLIALIGLIVLLIAGVYGVSEYRFRRTFSVEATQIAVPQGAAAIAEGRRLSVARGCADCHGKDMAGTVVIEDAMLGTIGASNLTKGEGGVGKFYTPATWARAIRHGVAWDGRTLLLMPSHEFAKMSDADVGALVAYFDSLTPVNKQSPPVSVGPLGRALFLGDVIALVPAEKIDHLAKPDKPEVAVSVEYGRYLSAGCTGCHGANYSGGAIPGGPPDWPAAANLTPNKANGIGNWSEADFIHAIREGKRPDGSAISEVMPWKNFGQMTDTELQALYLFLQQLPPLEKGNR